MPEELYSVTPANAPPAEWDGLVRVQDRRLDHMYLLPDVSFAGYTRVRLDPVEVSFYRNWNPNRARRNGCVAATWRTSSRPSQMKSAGC